MSNNLEYALEGDEAYVQTDAWEMGGISMQGVYASEDDLPLDNDDDVDETKESKAGPALGGWSFATQSDVASAACVGGHRKVAPNKSASTKVTRKPPSRPMTSPVNNRQHGSMPRRGALRPGGSVRMMPGPMAGARRPTNMTAGDSAKSVARVSVSRRQTNTTTSLVAGQGAVTRNKPAVAKTSGSVAGGNGEVAAGIPSQAEADEEKVDTSTEHIETKTKAVETKTEQVDTPTQHGEDVDCVQLVHKEATLHQEALKQAMHESVHEMNESRQHDEGKQVCDVELTKHQTIVPSLNNQAPVSVGVSLDQGKLETSTAVVDGAASVCQQTIGAHVLNYTHHKNVELWYSTDGWQTQQVKPLSFQSCGERVGQAMYVPGPNACNVEHEYWEVNLGFEVGLQDVEYVVKYECSRGVYWANNYGMNFKLHKTCEADDCGDVNATGTCNAGVGSVATNYLAKNEDEDAQLNLLPDDMIHKIAHQGLSRDVLHELIDAKPKLNEVDLDFVLWLRHANL